MAKKRKHPAGVASMNPDDMVSAGLPTDFDGEIIQVRLTAWDYDGTRDEHSLACRVTIRPDEDSGFEEFQQHYSAGDLKFFVPADEDGNQVDLESDDVSDWDGIYASAVGSREALSNSSNWAHFLFAAIDAGFKGVEPNVDCLEGVRGHFNRIPQKTRSGIVVEETGGETRTREILVLTEVTGQAKSASTSKSKSTKKTSAKKVAPADDDGELDDQLTAMVVKALEAAEGQILKRALPAIAMKAFDGSEKAVAVKRVSDVGFLVGREDSWVFDAEDGNLILTAG